MRDRDARSGQDAIGRERLARLKISRPVRHGAAGVCGGMFHPVVVAGGRVVGTWRRKLSARSASIAVEAFVRLGESVGAGIEAEAQRYRRFVDVGQIDVGYSKGSIAG